MDVRDREMKFRKFLSGRKICSEGKNLLSLRWEKAGYEVKSVTGF